MSTINIEAVVQRLVSVDTDIKLRVEAAGNLRDSLENYTQGPIYPAFLKKLVPILLTVLKGPPVFVSTSGEQKLRNCILEIIHRLPSSPPEPLEPYAVDIVNMLMGLIRVDNEDNAILCVKTIMDIIRHQSKVMGEKVQPFLDLIQEMFDTMDTVVRDQLDNPSPGGPSTSVVPGTPANFQSPRPGSPVASVSDLGSDQQQQTTALLKGMQSFKVIEECPIIVVSTFQVYRGSVPANVKKFVPLIKKVLLLQAQPQQKAHEEAAAKGTIFTGVSPNIKNRAAFGEFITAQIKTLSFLAYLLRAYAGQLTDFIPTLPTIVVRLLRDCPREKSAARKELLVGIRHIINFNFRKIFLPKIVELLDERTLIGDGLTVYDAMRPLAYSMLADLIHHVRDALQTEQIRKTVEVYTKNLQDSFPGTSFQTMSAKLLLNMAECIAKLENKADARHYLIMILNAIGDKFAAMNRQYPNAVKLSKLYKKLNAESGQESFLADKDHPPEWDEIDIFSATPIKSSNPRDRGVDPVADNKFLFRNLMQGLKTTFYQLKACNAASPVDPSNAPSHWQEVSYGFTAEEVQVIIKLFREGAYVFRYYEIENPDPESIPTSAVEFMANNYLVSSSKEEKDLLEMFATVFHAIDPATFHEVFQKEIPRLYEMIFEHTALLHIPQFFLASEATSPSFADMLLRFLMSRIQDVGTADVKKASVLLRLFKFAFMAVTLFANQNEQVLQPLVCDVVKKSIELSVTAEEPMNYFLLLRSLFRSIGGGKFEKLYQEILPLLEMLLETLNILLSSARKTSERDLYVELTLTVPARLSNLLPHLSYLMRPLVVALRPGSDLISQGLRTLELCVDNLTADYLDPIMAPVIDDLMTVLFSHLRPAPYSHIHSHTTLRILGKLGGRNRKFITGAPALAYQQYSDDRCSFDLRLVGSKKDRAFSADIGIELAINKLLEVPKGAAAKKSDQYYKRQAFHFIKTQLKLRIGSDALPDEFARLVRLQAQDLLARRSDADFSIFEASDKERSVAKRDEQEETIKKLIKACVFAASLPEIGEEATAFLLDLARHFTILEIGRTLTELKLKSQPFNVAASEGPLYVSSLTLADSLVESLASDVVQVREAAEAALQEVYSTVCTIFGSADQASRLGFFSHLSNTLAHACYAEEWFTKAGGSAGIMMLSTQIDLGDAWVIERQLEFCRALMYVIKDIPQDCPGNIRRHARDTLEVFLRRCLKSATKEDLKPLQAGSGPHLRPRLYLLCTFFCGELSHINPHVREASRAALEIISEVLDVEKATLVEPSKERLLGPIFVKPLRALPFPTQIGYIDAVTYCMSLRNDFVAVDDNLNRMLVEALALLDAPDEQLASKSGEHRTQQSIVALRVACIKILTRALTFDDFQKGPSNPTRVKIVSVFFKILCGDSQPAIETANSCLKEMIGPDSKIAREVLQGGLKPVVANVQNPRTLSVQNLNGLGRLVAILTSCFKGAIGAKFLDHIAVLTDTNALQRLSFQSIDNHESIKIFVSMFDIFYRLPPGAEEFKVKLIETVLDLEEKLRRTRSSPFREPVYKYINRWPTEVWEFLTTKLEELKYGRLLSQALEDPASGPLREVAMNNVDTLIKRCGDIGAENRETRYAAVINAINIMHAVTISPRSERWLNQKEHVTWFRVVGKKLEQSLRANTLPRNLRLAAEQAGDQLMVIFTRYLANNPKDLDTLFNLVDSITQEDFRADQVFFKYVYEHIVCSESAEYWRSVVLRVLEVYAGKGASQKTKAFLLHNLVNPIVAMDVMRVAQKRQKGSALLDKATIEAIHSRIWKAPLADPSDDLLQPYIDHTRMEVLQLTAMLVKYHHSLLQEARKDVIKFAWTYIRLEDVINKNAAYVVIGYFIAHYETPPKIVTQVYGALLRSYINEGRTLVTQALELIAPVLPKRFNPAPGERNLVWASSPRRILAEEGQNLLQITSIFQFLVRHPDLFYDSRDKFCTIIISSLRKIAQPPNVSNENRKLVLNLMTLIWQWEQRRVEGKTTSTYPAPSESPETRKRKFESDAQISTPSPSKDQSAPDRQEYMISSALRGRMIKYLAEFIASLTERYPVMAPKDPEPPSSHGPALPPPSTELCKRAMALFYNLVQPQYWGEKELELYPNVTDTVLDSERTAAVLAAEKKEDEKPDEKFITNMINTLNVVRIIVNAKSDEWVLKNMATLQRILGKSLKSENPEIQSCLHSANEELDDGRKLKPLMKRILDAVPEDIPMEDADADGEVEAPTSEVISFISGIATETMSSGNYIPGVNALWTLAQRKPSEMDQHIPQVMKALQSKLARDHVSHWTAVLGQTNLPMPPRQENGAASAEMSKYDLQIQTDLMIKAIEILALRMDVLGDSRRPFLSVLATLVEKSHTNSLCITILDMVESWIFRSEGTWPTLKEKTAVLLKMVSFEGRPDQTMLTKFLEVVIRIYEDPKVTRTELTVRMELAFLIGTRAQDVDLRNRFMTIFDKSQSRTASTRLAYVILSQNWETLSDSYWLAQASQLLFGSVELNNNVQLHQEDFRTMPASMLVSTYAKDTREPTLMADDKYETLMSTHRRFVSELGDAKTRDLIEPLSQLQHLDSTVSHQIWVTLFPMFWSAAAKDERGDLERGLVSLLTKDYHSRQLEKRPNVIQSLLEGAARAYPKCKIPPHVLKFEARTYDAWYSSLVQLEKAVTKPEMESGSVQESNLDALVELYANLQEEDLFYGTWRRRCQFIETNAALSYEQNGMWDKAQQMYEAAQIKARTGAIPFSQAEYMLWEDHWVVCAQKLQQWDILQDLAKHENYQDLLLECAWRSTEMWQNAENRDAIDSLIKGVMDAPTPRRLFFQAFMSLLKYHKQQETIQEFGKVVDEAIQLSVRKWHQLPRNVTNAHIPLLQNFQHLVELHDASIICQSLASTTPTNLDAKSNELKLLLGTWRDRLPNVWDDISAWQDLVTWRQHIFGLINQTYLQLLPQQQGQNAAGASFAYRGYHETAWIINRFAHVARKHNLPDVCINQLSRIYTLPNIEIQEAFLKLREQAKCHYQNPNELTNGLDVINNTNLSYFGPQQKAEFYTLKGMFLEKLQKKDEACEAYGLALFFDIKLPKAWAEWGQYSDRLFKENPTNYSLAKNALSCYLEAAGLFKNSKSRKLITRILWLLSLDDASGTLSAQFDDYKGETPVWYWITFIPQLLTGLSHKEALKTHGILAKIAKSYPQALYFQLRTNREDMLAIKKAQEAKEERDKQARKAREAKAAAQTGNAGNGSPAQTKQEAPVKTEASTNGTQVKTESNDTQVANGSSQGSQKRAPWELTEDILNILKTAFPLLALSMEAMVDQIQKHFKCQPDEDAYRLIVALLNDGLSYVNRAPMSYAQDIKLPHATETNITRFSETILPAHIRKSFEADFVDKKPTMFEYIHKLRRWRDKFEEKLDRRAKTYPLENPAVHLSEFRFQKFDDVEVPGQYLQHKDKNQDFVRIERLLPNVDLVRGIGVCHRRLRFRGNDGSVHTFAVQHPAPRHCRREERILQLFRHFNGTLNRKKESRRRNLSFHLPLMIPFTPHIRLVQDDASYVSLQSVYEEHCRRNGTSKDEPILFTMKNMKVLSDTKTPKQAEQAITSKLETFTAIQDKWVPHTVALDYFQGTYPTFADFWLFRRHFSYQFAALTFMTYVFHMHNRYPHKLSIARASGKVWGSELLSCMAAGKALFHNPEPVPFRLTPNLQTLMGPLATEGIYACAIMAIARCLTEPEDEMEQQLCLFVRDEMIFWYTSSRTGNMLETHLRESVQGNSELIVKKALSLARAPVGTLPANQTTIDLIAKAVNPISLSQCDALWMPYL